jgi:hypothetical protein
MKTRERHLMSNRDKIKNLHRWRKVARLQLAEHPLCANCLKEGKITAAQVADHIVPHRGDVNLFWQGKLNSLCWSCHSNIKQQQEINGFSRAIASTAGL